MGSGRSVDMMPAPMNVVTTRARGAASSNANSAAGDRDQDG
jgi:hypothetical protein